MREALGKYADRKVVDLHTVRIIGGGVMKALPHNPNLTLFDWETPKPINNPWRYVRKQIPSTMQPKQLEAGPSEPPQPNVALILTSPEEPQDPKQLPD